MILYETTFIVNPQSDDSVIDEKVKAVAEVISSNGGKIIHEDRMGTRRLAYPIDKLHQGYYATFLYEAEQSVLPILERHMKLGEEYMRHLTIRFEGDPEKLYGDKKSEEKIPRVVKSKKVESASTESAAVISSPEKSEEGEDTAEIIIEPFVEEAGDSQPEPEKPAEDEEL